MCRKLRGPMAPWRLNELLLRQVLFAVQGGNWQRAGGKGQKPKPIPLPETKTAAQPGVITAANIDAATRLRNLSIGSTDD